jgi:LPXTG-site transpeptidase (sortase) family protein
LTLPNFGIFQGDEMFTHNMLHRRGYIFFHVILIVVLALSLGMWTAPAQAKAPEKGNTAPLLNTPPSLSLSVPATAFIGTNVTFTVTFDNTDTVPGYGPLIDLIIPRNGADGAQNTNLPLDGLTFINATYLGSSIENTVLTFPGSGGVTCVNHPYMVDSTGAPVQVCGNAGDTFVALRLPFGSFTPDQPPLTVNVTASMSTLADLGTPLTIQARGGYQFGFTPLNDYCCGDDPSVSLSAWTSGSVTPTLFTLSKTYNGPEDETATGPNFPRRYTVTAEIAPGQTMTSFNLTDVLPNNMQFVSLVGTSPGGAACSHTNPAAPGGTLSCNFTSVSGTVTMTFEYYIPLRDSASASVIDPASGDDVTSCNNASGGGTWTPIDARDTGGTFTQDPAGCEHTLTDKSIATQKSVSVVGGGQPAPGQVLEYVIDVQISDFFAFDQVVLTDIISDGQRFDTTFTPTLQIIGNPASLNSAGGFNAANYTVAPNYTPADPAPNDGTTTITFRISDEMIARSADGRLIGGCVPPGGVAGDPDCGGYNDGPTTARVVFRTVIQEDFSDTFPSGDTSVDQGDVLNNTVNVNGRILSTTDVSTPTGFTEADGSSASVTIARGALTKTIYAINGFTTLPSPVRVTAGDRVTYRLTYTLPTSDFEDLVITDYLPLPIFDATQVTTHNNTVCGIPAPGTSCLLSSDTYNSLPGAAIPTVTSNGSSNWVRWTYGDYDSASNPSSVIDLLFTVTVQDDPFADNLHLTNQAYVTEGATNGTPGEAASIIELTYTAPVMTTTKSVVATDNPAPTFTPSLPVAFTAPGSAGPRWSGTINSSLLTSTPIDSDVSGLDAGDLVTFAIILVNEGNGIKGAFDITIKDTFDALGFEYPTPGDPNSLNLQIYYGNGSGPISYTDVSNNPTTADTLFGAGIKLVDPVGQGVCSAHDPNLGNNVIVITYDLRMRSDITPGTYPNTASLVNYSGSEGGPNFLPQPDEDTANVTTDAPLLAKTLVGTEFNTPQNSNTQAVIGEFVTYTLTLTVPEGVLPAAQIVDTLDAGLAFVDLQSVTVSNPDTDGAGAGDDGIYSSVMTFDGGTGACTNCTAGTGAGSNPLISAFGGQNGRRITFDFGNLVNTNRDNNTPETITITYRAVVLNVVGNQAGGQRNNSAALTWTGGSLPSVSAPNVTIIEPVINTAKSVSPAAADAGDTVTFTVTLTNPAAGSTTAYDVSFSDTLPAALTYVPGTLALGACTASTPLTLSDISAPTLTGSGGLFQPGESCAITFQATVNYSAAPGQVITNTAVSQWTSLSGSVSDRSTFNTDSDERTGADGVGGALNDYASQSAANLTINSIQPQKTLVATSEAHTGAVSGIERVAIGEILRYRLVVSLPEGTSANFQIQDLLPGGLTYLDDGTARLALLSNQTPILSSEPAGSTLALALGSGAFGTNPWVNGNDPTLVTPTYAFPDQNVGSSNSLTADPDAFGDSADPFFKLGTLTNNDSDSDGEYVIIEFNALVNNTAAGSNDAGDARDNTFSVFINGTQNGASSTPVQVIITEPSITDLSKTAVPASGDAGDVITYTLTFSNTNGVNNTTAFDVQVTDTIPARMTFNAGSMNITSTGSCATGITDNTVAPNIAISIDAVPAGCAVTITYTATLNATVTPQEVIANTADITYTSLPGATGTSPNPTGSTTPGASGTDNGERDGSNGARPWNDYHDQASDNVTIPGVTIAKQITTTSASHTVGTNVAIGEEITYDILLTFPEGTTPADTVVDDLPTGLEVVAGTPQIITTAAASAGVLASDFNGSIGTQNITVVSGDGGSVQFDLTNVVTNEDGNNNTNNTILLRFRARVTNILANQNGTVISNEATNQVGSNPAATSNSVSVTVVEPELNIAKTVDDATPAPAQTFTYTLTIQHLTSSTANAFDLNISDLLPAGVTVSGAPTVSDAPAACAGTVTNSSVGNNISLTIASLPLNCVLTIQYSAQIASPPTNPGDAIINTASFTWTSLLGVDPNERTGAGGVNDYADSDGETINFTAIDLTLSKDDGGIVSSAGGIVSYTLSYSNAGNSLATSVTITETVPADTTFNASNSTPGWSCAPDNSAGSTCTFNLGTLNPGDNGSVTFAVTVDNPLPAGVTQITNTASIGDDGTHGLDANSSNNTDSDTTPVSAVPDLVITKDDGFTVASPGQVITYTLTISNVGTQDATGVVVTDTLPANTTFVSASDSGAYNNITGVVTWPAFDLAAGAPAVTRTVTIQVNDPFPGASILNQAHVADDGTNGADPTPANNDASDTDIILTLPGSDLTKTLIATNQGFTSNPSVAVGEVVTYRITFTVPAGGSLTNLTLTDTLDRGLAFLDCLTVVPSSVDITTSLPGGFTDACNDPTNPTIAAEPSGSSNAADAARRVTFNLGTVNNSGASNGTVVVDYTAVVLDSLENQDGLSLNNSVVLAWDSGTLTTAASDVTIIEPDFELVKSVDRTVALPGSTLIFTLTLRHSNTSNVDAFDVALTDVLPTGLTYVPGSLTILSGPAGGVTDDSSAPTLRVTWANFPLLTGSSRTEAVVQFQATLGALNPGQQVRNTASLAWTSLPGNVSSPQSPYNTLSTERFYDPLSDVNVYGVAASALVSIPRLPDTGFAPGVITSIPEQPAEKAYQALGDFWLEIPKLGVKLPIVGIPAQGEEWDLTWLSNQAGWLEGTAYPTHAGNSAITAHVYLPNGQPGPFLNLSSLRYGDQIIVHLGGQRYIFEVRQAQQVSPYSLSPLRHEKLPWLTLITCREYDAKTNTYKQRVVIRAVLMKVEAE